MKEYNTSQKYMLSLNVIIFNFSIIFVILNMSYTMNNNLSRTPSYMPEYDNNSYKIQQLPSLPQNYNPYQIPNQPYYPPSNSSSIALFNISADGTNSLYIDGVPNDTN
jgi:hypothetical protein